MSNTIICRWYYCWNTPSVRGTRVQSLQHTSATQHGGWKPLHCVRGAPSIAANRLHGQRIGAFSRRPVWRLTRKTDKLRLDSTKSCVPGRWDDWVTSVRHLALGMCSGISRIATNLIGFVSHAYYPPTSSMTQTTHHSHDQLHTCTCFD